MRTVAVILAAGQGTRVGFDKTQFALGGKPLWRHSFDTFQKHPAIDGVGLLGSHANIDALLTAEDPLFVDVGGTTRTESSRKAVDLADADLILIHDAARPFVSSDLITRVVDGLQTSPAVAPGVPVADTIRWMRDGKSTTPPRQELFAMQTPQGAHHSALRQAYKRHGGEFTDEMALMEADGVQPTLVPGDPQNFKVTTPDDLARAMAHLGGPEVRTGLGYDIHAVASDDRPLILGGVPFDGPGLDGHSDADVVLHAVTDALLGAAAMGDIGQHFPNTDPAWKGAPSTVFLTHAADLLRGDGWNVVNLDISVIAEFPKIMVRAQDIRRSIANAVGVEPSRVSIKATTNERLGAIGRSEGIAAFAVATIRRI